MATEALTFEGRTGKLGGAMMEVYISGSGMTRVGRRSEPLQELMADAAHGALADAGIERPGMLVVAAMMVIVLIASLVAPLLLQPCD